MIRYYLVFVLFLTLWGCQDQSRIYEQNKDFSEKFWLVDDTPEFEFEINETSRSYDLFYNIRNSISYPYHNLYVKYTLEDSLGNMISSKLQNMDLFDPVTGKPYGDGLGDIFDHRILALDDQKFDKPGIYRFRVQQFMRQDTLPMILSVGLRVSYAQSDDPS